jgi:hypothetical protein
METLVVVRQGNVALVRVLIEAVSGRCYVASPRTAEAVRQGERGAIGFPVEDVFRYSEDCGIADGATPDWSTLERW